MKPVMQTRGYDPTAPAGEQRGNCWTACAHTWRFLNERGYLLTIVDLTDPGEGPYIQCGLSPRSPAADGKAVYHAVIYQGGHLVHDPHPDGLGVVSIEDAYAVVPR